MNPSFSEMPFYVKFSIFFVGICAFGFFAYSAQGILIPLCFALLLSILLEPVVALFKKLKLPRTIAIALTVILVCIILIALAFFISEQVSLFNESLPKFKEKISLVLERFKHFLSTSFNIDMQTINSQADKWRKKLFEDSGLVLGYTFTTVTSVVFSWVLMPVYVFFFLVYQSLAFGFIQEISAKKDLGTIGEVMIETRKMVQSYLTGLFFEAIIIAFLNSIGLLILGIDYAILIGVIGAILNVIPYIGGIVSVIIPMFVAVATKDPVVTPLLVLGVYLTIQFIDNHFIVPFIVASRVKINSLVAIVVVLIFGEMFGIAGMFLAIPFTAILKIICDRIDNLHPYGLLLGTEVPSETKFSAIFRRSKKNRPDPDN